MPGFADTAFGMQGKLKLLKAAGNLVSSITPDLNRFYHEHAGGNENTVWWSTNDDIYKYYESKL
jgi:hypothetical protein